MTIICLFAQRKERREGESAPELLAAIDSVGNDDNPDYLNQAEANAAQDKDLAFTRRLTVEISQKAFDRIFYGKETLKGTVGRPA